MVTSQDKHIHEVSHRVDIIDKLTITTLAVQKLKYLIPRHISVSSRNDITVCIVHKPEKNDMKVKRYWRTLIRSDRSWNWKMLLSNTFQHLDCVRCITEVLKRHTTIRPYVWQAWPTFCVLTFGLSEKILDRLIPEP